MIETSDYEEKYNDFWKDIVENADGSLNKDQIMRELSDYSMVMENCALAYCRMTKQNISKQNTMFFEVEALFEEFYLDKDIVVDDLKNMLDSIDDINELKLSLREYFDIAEEEKNERI